MLKRKKATTPRKKPTTPRKKKATAPNNENKPVKPRQPRKPKEPLAEYPPPETGRTNYKHCN